MHEEFQVADYRICNFQLDQHFNQSVFKRFMMDG